MMRVEKVASGFVVYIIEKESMVEMLEEYDDALLKWRCT